MTLIAAVMAVCCP